MDGTDLCYFAERLGLTAPPARLSPRAQHRLFVEPRCHGAWVPRDVPDGLLVEAWDLARMGPTSANGSPLRLVLLRSDAEKAGVLPMLDRSNREKSRLAPVVAIFAHDVEFWRHLRRLHGHVDAAAWFRHDPALARETAFRNGTLQAAYFMAALRALGLDIGPLSGFDVDAVQAAYFAGTTFEINFICNIGYGDPVDPKPRLPRLELEEIVHRPALRP
ncbi:MAG: malonic semialdehyde reductase [Geminicoccaceae bacterium]